MERTDGGLFVSPASDDEILAAYEEHGSTRKVAEVVGITVRNVQKRLAKMRADGRITASVLPRPELEDGFRERLASIPTDGPDGAALHEVSVSFYQQGAKDEFSQQLVKHNLDSIGAKYRVGRKALIVPPRPSLIEAYRALEPPPLADVERVFIWGDTQIGFWLVREGPKSSRYVPFHDEAAIDIGLQALALHRPTTLVIIGDFIDFPQLSRFQQEPEFAQTLQDSVYEAEALIAKLRATVGADCTIIFIPGNHETRMQRKIANDAPELYNLTRPGEKHALYSIPSLLCFERHRVECMAEYPSGQYWIAKRRGQIPGLVATHADPRKSDMRADSVHGHLVLPGVETFAREYEDGWVTYTRMCVSGFGNYSDTGDKVRLTRTNTPSGRSRMAHLQSFGTIDINRTTGQRAYGLHVIRAGAVRFMDRDLSSSIERAA